MSSVRRRATGAALLLACAAGSLAAQGGKESPPPTSKMFSSVTVAIDPTSYQGPCPAKMTLIGTIVTSGIPKAPITYEWVHSDSTTSPKRTVTMTSNAAVVTDSWAFGMSGQMMRVSAKLHIIAPAEHMSKPATAAVLCR